MYQKRNIELAIGGLYLSGYKKEFYLREISKRTKMPLKTTQNAVAILEQNNILKSTTVGKNKYFRLNLENLHTKFYLMQSEIYKTALFLNKFSIFKTFLKGVKTNDPIILFGSFAKFTADRDSDLDLLVISKANRNPLPFHLLPYKIHEIKLSEAAFIKALEKQETLLKEIEENHVVLNNHSFYVDNMWVYYGK